MLTKMQSKMNKLTKFPKEKHTLRCQINGGGEFPKLINGEGGFFKNLINGGGGFPEYQFSGSRF